MTAINRDISEIQVRSTLATTVADVRNAYWELLFALQALDVARGSLDLAEKLVEDNRARVEVGTMAPLDVVQSEAEAATRRQTVAQAEATLGTAELSLKRLIVSGTDDPLWRSTITPIDRPEFAPEPLDVEGAVQRAFATRTDLEQARRTIDSNDVTIKFLQQSDHAGRRSRRQLRRAGARRHGSSSARAASAARSSAPSRAATATRGTR